MMISPGLPALKYWHDVMYFLHDSTWQQQADWFEDPPRIFFFMTHSMQIL